MALTYKQFKDHLILAIGGYPSLAPLQTQDERLSQICNHAGDYLYSLPWNFRTKTSRMIGVVSNQSYATLDSDVSELISVTSYAAYVGVSRIVLVTPQELDAYRSSAAVADLANPAYVYACLSRPWADEGTSTEIAAGSAFPSKALDLFPTPTATMTNTMSVRYRTAFPQTTSLSADNFLIAVPQYCEALLIACGRAFAMGYEEEGLQQQLLNIQNGPLLAMAVQTDGMTLTDSGIIRRSSSRFAQQAPQQSKKG